MSLLSNAFIGLYGSLWRAARPLLRRHKRLKEDFDLRFDLQNWPRLKSGGASDCKNYTLWIQAASGGEAWLLHSLVPALVSAFQAKYSACPTMPVFNIFCTTCTSQGLDVLNKLKASLEWPDSAYGHAGASACRPNIFPALFPLDEPKLMQHAMQLIDPAAVVVLETELWPGLFFAAKNAAKDLHIINARMTSKSAALYKRMRFFFKEYGVKQILAISQADADRFATLFCDSAKISVMANIKFDRLFASIDATDFTSSGWPEAKPDTEDKRRDIIPMLTVHLVFASIREEEENDLMEVISNLRNSTSAGTDLRIVIAPRHMHRVESWCERLNSAGMICQLRSENTDKTAPTGATLASSGFFSESTPPPIQIWNTFGELALLYTMADVVFVGGSLAPLGGQNFLEALAGGVTPVIGPSYSNFAWVGEDIFELGLAHKVKNKTELVYTLKDLIAQHAAFISKAENTTQAKESLQQKKEDVRKRFTSWLSPHLGGSAVAASAIIAEFNVETGKF